MQYRKLGQCDFTVSAVGLGTWVMGGYMWGDSDDKQAETAIEKSLELGITLIDTAPIYGFGRAEQIVGRVLERLKKRDKAIIATKFGLEWDDRRRWVRRNSSRKRLLKEIDESRKRLQTDVIDIYQVHWPDETTPLEETMESLFKFYQAGTIRAIGVSNFDVSQMRVCLKIGPLHCLQPPYNLFERDIEEEILPFCVENKIAVLGYGALCRGLLSGKFHPETVFAIDDLRSSDPKFQGDNFRYYLKAIKRLKDIADKYKVTPGQLAIRWASEQKGITSVLVGARSSEQAQDNAGAFNFLLTQSDMDLMEKIVQEEIPEPIGPDFMAPPRSRIT